MKILLVNIDSKQPNLALHKIEKYHLDRENTVQWYSYPMTKEIKWKYGFFNKPTLDQKFDKIYVSCVFSKNKEKCKIWEGEANRLMLCDIVEKENT